MNGTYLTPCFLAQITSSINKTPEVVAINAALTRRKTVEIFIVIVLVVAVFVTNSEFRWDTQEGLCY